MLTVSVTVYIHFFDLTDTLCIQFCTTCALWLSLLVCSSQLSWKCEDFRRTNTILQNFNRSGIGYDLMLNALVEYYIFLLGFDYLFSVKSAKCHNFLISNMAKFMEVCYLERRVGGRFWVMTYWNAWRACPMWLLSYVQFHPIWKVWASSSWISSRMVLLFEHLYIQLCMWIIICVLWSCGHQQSELQRWMP